MVSGEVYAIMSIQICAMANVVQWSQLCKGVLLDRGLLPHFLSMVFTGVRPLNGNRVGRYECRHLHV